MRKLTLSAALILLAGCVAQNDPRLKEVEDLRTTATSLKTELQWGMTRINSMQTDVSGLQFRANSYQTATFAPGEPGSYSRVDSGGGTFLLSIKNVSPA